MLTLRSASARYVTSTAFSRSSCEGVINSTGTTSLKSNIARRASCRKTTAPTDPSSPVPPPQQAVSAQQAVFHLPVRRGRGGPAQFRGSAAPPPLPGPFQDGRSQPLGGRRPEEPSQRQLHPQSAAHARDDLRRQA